jgi:ribose transport system permease protein
LPDVTEQLVAVGVTGGDAVSGATALPAPPRGPRRQLRLASDYGIVGLALAIFLVAAVAVPGFGSLENLETLMRDASFVGIVALGMTFVVISGNYVDLSVAAQVGIAAICVIALQPQGLLLGLACGVVACLAVGVVNGIAVGYLRANAVVVTLGVGTIALAVLNEATQGALYAGQVAWYADAMGASLGPLPISFLVFLLVAGIAYLLLDRMGYGRRLRAVGANAAAAEIAGVARSRVVLGGFLISAACCAISGFLVAGFANSANPGIASDYTFEALAAVIVGGNSLTGGRGGAERTVIGVMLIAIIANLLVVGGLSFEWQQFVKGIVIVAAVAFDAAMRRAGAR